jgi:hypothetical protein
MFHLAFLLTQVNLCQPVRDDIGTVAYAANNVQAAKQWDPTITWGKCLSAVPFYTSMASLTITFDVIV